MENSTVRRGLIVVVLITCSMLLLWWLIPNPADPTVTPSPSVTAT